MHAFLNRAKVKVYKLVAPTSRFIIIINITNCKIALEHCLAVDLEGEHCVVYNVTESSSACCQL